MTSMLIVVVVDVRPRRRTRSCAAWSPWRSTGPSRRSSPRWWSDRPAPPAALSSARPKRGSRGKGVVLFWLGFEVPGGVFPPPPFGWTPFWGEQTLSPRPGCCALSGSVGAVPPAASQRRGRAGHEMGQARLLLLVRFLLDGDVDTVVSVAWDHGISLGLPGPASLKQPAGSWPCPCPPGHAHDAVRAGPGLAFARDSGRKLSRISWF